MTGEQVTDAGRSGTIRSKISMARTRETLQTNCALFVDKNIISLGVVAASEAESSIAKVSSSSTSSSSTSSSSSCQLKKPVYDQHKRIYKRNEMARGNLCLRYLLAASFILLGISGAIVCGTGSYFVHQLHGSLTNPVWYGPPSLLLTTGIVNIILGAYFWFSLDNKYNRPQLFMFFILIVLVAIIEAAAGIWAIVDHGKVDSSIAKILENNLASVGTIDERPAWNITEIKVKCCGFVDSSSFKEEDKESSDNRISWSCCNSKSYNENQLNNDLDMCAIFYINECRDLALHRYRSVLFYTFVVALCATILQILESLGLQAYSKRFLLNKRQRRSIVTSPNEPHSRVTCPVVQLGAQHVCEGCSSVQYQER